MNARAWSVLGTRAGGAGQLTRGSKRKLEGRLCLRCGRVAADQPIDIEVEPESPDVVMGIIEAVRKGTADEVVRGLAPPLNWVRPLNLAIVREDLLELLLHFTHSKWHLGCLRTRTSGLRPELHTLHASACLQLRGSASSKINACSACGRFLYFAMPPRYLLESDAPAEEVTKVESMCKFVIESRVAEEIRRKEHAAWSSLDIYDVPVRKEPVDSLPPVLPATWEEYEAHQRSQGRQAVLPKQPWVPNPRLKDTLGAWDLAYIQRHGIEARFERPDPWQMALMIASYEAADRDAAMDTLSDWGKPFREEVGALMRRALAKYEESGRDRE